MNYICKPRLGSKPYRAVQNDWIINIFTAYKTYDLCYSMYTNATNRKTGAQITQKIAFVNYFTIALMMPTFMLIICNNNDNYKCNVQQLLLYDFTINDVKPIIWNDWYNRRISITNVKNTVYICASNDYNQTLLRMHYQDGMVCLEPIYATLKCKCVYSGKAFAFDEHTNMLLEVDLRTYKIKKIRINTPMRIYSIRNYIIVETNEYVTVYKNTINTLYYKYDKTTKYYDMWVNIDTHGRIYTFTTYAETSDICIHNPGKYIKQFSYKYTGVNRIKLYCGGIITIQNKTTNKLKALDFSTLRTSYLTPTKIAHTIKDELWLVVNS